MENLAIWSIPPDWTDGVTESLEWLTSVTESVHGYEQRRGLRRTPRKIIEYNYILSGPDREYFDLLMLRSAGSEIYLPVWYEGCVLPDGANAIDTILHCDTSYTEFPGIEAVLIWRDKPWNALGFAVTEVALGYVTLAFPVGVDLPPGTRIYPLRKFRVQSQPATSHLTHLVMRAKVRFESMDIFHVVGLASALGLYRELYVLEMDPNEAEDLSYDYQRLQTVLDNKTGIPELYDVRGYVAQQFHWWAKTREKQIALRTLFYALEGQRIPVWVPTYYRDFEPWFVEGRQLYVEYCGFTDLGGPTPDRGHIVFEFRNGVRYYRQIVSSTVGGENEYEVLILDEPLDTDVSQIRRISFITISRLTQDTVELTHHTDTRGLTTATTVFRCTQDALWAVRHKGGPFYDLADPDTVTAASMHYVTTLPPYATTLLVAGWCGYANTATGYNWMVYFLQQTPGFLMEFSIGDGSRIPVGHFAIVFALYQTDATHLVDGYVEIPVDLTTGWHSYAVSVDTSTQTLQIVIDRVLYPVGPYIVWDSNTPMAGFYDTVGDIEYGGTQSGFPDRVSPSPAMIYESAHEITLSPYSPSIFVGDFRFGMGEPFFDLTIEANLNRLFSPSNHRVKWGAQGELVTGLVPALYLTGDAQKYQTNQASGEAGWEYHGFSDQIVPELS